MTEQHKRYIKLKKFLNQERPNILIYLIDKCVDKYVDNLVECVWQSKDWFAAIYGEEEVQTIEKIFSRYGGGPSDLDHKLSSEVLAFVIEERNADFSIIHQDGTPVQAGYEYIDGSGEYYQVRYPIDEYSIYDEFAPNCIEIVRNNIKEVLSSNCTSGLIYKAESLEEDYSWGMQEHSGDLDKIGAGWRNIFYGTRLIDLSNLEVLDISKERFAFCSSPMSLLLHAHMLLNYHEILLKSYLELKKYHLEPSLEIVDEMIKRINEASIYTLGEIITECESVDKLIIFTVALRGAKDPYIKKTGTYCLQYMFTDDADEKKYYQDCLRAFDDTNRIKEDDLAVRSSEANVGQKILASVTSDGFNDNSFNNIEIIYKYLISGADLEVKDSKGFISLMHCASKGYINTLNLLIKFGADMNAQNNYLTTSCAWAARHKHKKVVEELAFMGADVNIPCLDGDTALISATRHFCYDEINILLNYGAYVNLANNKGETPLSIALASRDKTKTM